MICSRSPPPNQGSFGPLGADVHRDRHDDRDNDRRPRTGGVEHDAEVVCLGRIPALVVGVRRQTAEDRDGVAGEDAAVDIDLFVNYVTNNMLQPNLVLMQ